jgi:tRNA-dependent cyclodipeptide synthase
MVSKKNSAFVGVSLDSQSFTREWIDMAVSHILGRHDDMLFLLADSLMAYNKFAQFDGETACLSIQKGTRLIEKRRTDICTFLKRAIGARSLEEQTRIGLAQWNSYCDSHYANLLRMLRIAYATIRGFRASAESCAVEHFSRHPSSADIPQRIELCTSYIIEETAMSIRITEFGDRPFEYYPDNDIELLTPIYEGQFAKQGLTIESLTGNKPKRVFRCLP